jgi:hypothetical protein
MVTLNVRQNGGPWAQYELGYEEPFWNGRIESLNGAPIFVINKYGIEFARLDLAAGRLEFKSGRVDDRPLYVDVDPMTNAHPPQGH